MLSIPQIFHISSGKKLCSKINLFELNEVCWQKDQVISITWKAKKTITEGEGMEISMVKPGWLKGNAPHTNKKKKSKQYQTGIVKTTKFPRKMGISGRSPERPGGAVVKNPPAKEGHARGGDSIPGSGRSPGGGNGNPLLYYCLDSSMDRGAWQGTVHGLVKSHTWLRNWARTQGLLLALDICCHSCQALSLLSVFPPESGR